MQLIGANRSMLSFCGWYSSAYEELSSLVAPMIGEGDTVYDEASQGQHGNFTI